MSEKGAKKNGWFVRFIKLLNILALIALSLCYLGGTVDPEKYWPLAFAAMSYPIILIGIILLSVYWLFKKYGFLFINIAFILIRWDYVPATVQFIKSTKTEPEQGIKVMTYNVRLFDYFNWTKDKNTGTRIFDFIYRQQPDILCIQEFYLDKKDHFPTMDTLVSSNKINHAHIKNYRDNQTEGRFWGMATFTSYPIVNKGVIDFASSFGNRCLFTDVLINKDTVRIYNIHLQSIRIGQDQYQFLDQIMLTQSMAEIPTKDLFGDLKLLIYRMAHGFIQRGKQADLVAEHIKDCPYPTIVCGDFNDTPTSYAYRTLARGLTDSFVAQGSGLGNTYVRIPFFRIDNVFYSSHFNSLEHTVLSENLSDHFAITAVLKKTE